ncbi:putative membrane protein [Bacillus thermophilus]|uniref:Membrane protein n=1 Tax=Siminovitchia thermophila TaxID=1245522 RepID=A0ABS2R1H8_9BACI|nr:DUF1648 domain-containing protein [Siminovitchia thermophila]MBM7713429.1 putative membrane protein [Siminovitchia thermophila]
MSNSWERPKLKIPKTKSEWFWDIIGCSLYMASILLLIFIWNQLPDKVPAHYNALGEVDRWGSKSKLLILPGMGAFIIVFMRFFEKRPELHNYPERLNESNAKQFYLLSRKMVNQIKNICLIIFVLITFESVSIALGWSGEFGVWFLPVAVILLLTPIAAGLLKQRKIK